MKQRFSSLDVKVISRELNSALTSLRVSNIYDLSSRIFLFKLAKPDHRKQLIIDSGFRCHITEYSRATATAPSGFVSRLRKFLKSRRVSSVSQIGTDRIIDIEFSEGQYHIFLEFFAGGNIILTDREYTILALFRQVSEGGDQEEVKVGLKYNLSNKQNYGGVPELSVERLRETLQKAVASAAAAQEEEAAPKKSKKKPVDVLRKALSQGFPEYPPLLLDHAFSVKGFDPATPPEQVLQDDGLLGKVMEVLEEAESVNKRLSVGDKHPGYIVAREDKAKEDDKQAETPAGAAPSKKPTLLYEDFHPFKPHQFEGKPGITILEFDGFNKTVDEYFSTIESQKLESRLTEREENAKRKLEAARKEHEKRIGALHEVQELHVRKAEAIGANILRVQEAIDAVNGLIAQGMDWVEIARLIEMEQGRGNPVAKIIKLPLKLYENTITLLLSEASYEGDEEDEAYVSGDSDESESEEGFQAKEAQRQAQRESKLLEIDIDLGLSPWANATQYYEQKKVAAVKEKKTIESSAKALKSQEKKVTEDLKRSLQQEKQVLRPARKPFWFEKYMFFISSDGYLVLGGRDANQTEILYRRYLKKGDIFVHADIDGATPIIVKNRQGTPDAPIPPGTLSQAGNLCVATSVAWDSKAVMSAWWVHANQVSKTTETGELLKTGGFIIKGEKNYLAPSQLVLGFAVMFQITLESIPNHRKHRIQEQEQEQAPPATEADAERIEAPKARKEQLDKEQDETAKAEDKVEKEEEKEEEEAEEEAEEKADEVDGQEEGSEFESEEDRSDELPAENPLQSRDPEPVKEDVNVMEKNDELVSGGGGEDEKEHTHDQEENQEAPDDTTAPAENAESASASRPLGKRYLSARERRLLKKGKPLDSPASTKDAAGEESPTPATETPSRSTTPSVAQQPTKQISAPQVRGKKGKAKKAAAKYADQDEEERELALRLLGSKAKEDKKAAAAAAKAAREAELEAQKQRRRAQHERAAEAERKRQALLEEGADEYDEETAEAEAADLAWLPALVGTPLPEDDVLAAIPVCAPWAALTRYKYRAKLQPGTVKKGKAVKEILGHWIAEASPGGKKGKKDEYLEEAGVDRATAERMRAKEAELIKAWRDVEVINTLPVSKVRIVSGGGGGAAGGGDGKGKGKDKGKDKGGKGGKKK